MNAEQTLWLAALRSGKYKQGRGRLRSADDKYCCLGIACEVAGMRAELEMGRYIYYEPDSSDYHLAYLGHDHAVRLEIDGLMPTLAEMNDETASFAEIADFLEATWLSQNNR